MTEQIIYFHFKEDAAAVTTIQTGVWRPNTAVHDWPTVLEMIHISAVMRHDGAEHLGMKSC